jgi:ankyrin repeat protein
MQGHHYLLKDMLRQIDIHQENTSHKRQSLGGFDPQFKQLNTKYQFLNCIDRDFSTPLILALKNKRTLIINELLEQAKICLRQSSMKYGSPLHVSLSNEEFKISIRLLRLMKSMSDIDYSQDLNKIDEDGNTPMHILMKVFNVDPPMAKKIGVSLIKKGASLKYRNKN